jgi:hypothetical protein
VVADFFQPLSPKSVAGLPPFTIAAAPLVAELIAPHNSYPASIAPPV